MKNVKMILHYLKTQNNLKKLQTFDAYRKLKDALPYNLRQSIFFIYKKNKTIFFVLKHQTALIELKHNIQTLKDILRLLSLKEPNIEYCDDIRFFISHKVQPKNIPLDEELIYHEHSDGNFANKAKDKDIHFVIERIREIICKN